MLTINIFARVFHIGYLGKTGTAFTIDVDNRQYLVTAKHVVKGLSFPGIIQIFHDKQWKNMEVKPIWCTNPSVDIVVLAPPERLSPALP